MTKIHSVAFLGLGLMGAPMAERLITAGLQPRLWNRSREKTLPLLQKGGVEASRPADAAQDADCVILMFDTPDTTRAVLFEQGVAGALQPGALVIDMSSNSPDFARDCARQLKPLGIDHLDAPVSGGVAGATAGTLAIMAGGAQADFDRARPVFQPMGRAARIGASGTGQLAKLANQIIVAITVGAVSEALLLARAGGADPAAVRDALSGGFADSRILQLHGQRMIEGNFQPGGTVSNQIKDLDAATKAASEVGLSLPLLKHVRKAFRELAEQGDADKDHSALFLWLERFTKSKQQGPRWTISRL